MKIYPKYSAIWLLVSVSLAPEGAEPVVEDMQIQQEAFIKINAIRWCREYYLQ
jgi:hypothetical protein